MKCVCIIDIDQRSLLDIRTSLEQIGGALKIFEFSEFETFQSWVNDSLKVLSENPKSEKIEIKLVIGDYQFIGPKYFELIEKIRKLFLSNSFCTELDPTKFVVTTYESPKLEHKLIENSLISNVIFKPFDKAILLQHLRIALSGNHTVSDSSVFKQKVKVQAEMLKRIQMELYSEVGFVTKSNKAIPINSIAKYYGMDLFQPDRSFCYARCVNCTPKIGIEGEFDVELEYFGLSNSKNKFVRQALFRNHDELEIQGKGEINQHSNSKINIALIQDVENSEIKEFLERKYKNIEVDIISEEEKIGEIYGDKKALHAVIVNLKVFEKNIIKKWKASTDRILPSEGSRRVFLATLDREISDGELKEFSSFITDVVQLPLDRTYFFKRLSYWFPQLILTELGVACLVKKGERILKVGMLVDLIELSEAGLSMKYYREISYSSFRRFAVGVTEEPDTPEILGSCYFHEKAGNAYINHFVFFGITDHHLKRIRKWILDSYILTKQSA